MLSHRFKTIFVHVPKTAGQSIEIVFLREHGITWETREGLLLRANTDPNLGPQRLAHLYASEYLRCGHVTEIQWSTYFKFAVVRDPYDRAVSEYCYRAKGGETLERFLHSVTTDDWRDAGRHMAPQIRFVTGVDEILRYERLESEIAPVFKRVFGKAIGLPHINRASRCAPDISREAADLIYKRFEADFDHFGYCRR